MPIWLIKIIVGAALSFISSLFAPKPEPPKAGGLDDFNIPKAKEGSEIGKVFGTVTIRSPHVAAYGDLRTEAIRAKGGKK